MVIVLLLLLSILGTAFISTSHNDRINSQQNILNVQSEANFDGLSKIIGGLFVDDLNDALGNFRGMMTSSFPPGYLGQWNAAQTYSAGNTVNDPANPANFYTCIKYPHAGNLTHQHDLLVRALSVVESTLNFPRSMVAPPNLRLWRHRGVRGKPGRRRRRSYPGLLLRQ